MMAGTAMVSLRKPFMIQPYNVGAPFSKGVQEKEINENQASLDMLLVSHVYNRKVIKLMSYGMGHGIQLGKPVIPNLDAIFAALADPTRRAIVARLAEGEASVTELVEPFAMSQPAISKHLKVLERAGLISRGRDAQRRPCKLEAQPLAEANEWLERYREVWEQNFARLDFLLEELKAEEGRTRSVKTRQKRKTHKGN